MAQRGNRYFLTGAQGFVGAWIIKVLLEDKKTSPEDIIATDVRPNDSILKQLIPEKLLRRIPRENVDVRDFKKVQACINKYKPTYVLHLAGLQIPTCRANPVLGAQVNVMGTVNVFESVKQLNDASPGTVQGVVYASSGGICGAREDYVNSCAKDNDRHVPRTHYGVYKLANEGNGRIYWQDHAIPSVGLRPMTVYGVGREVGLTSDATKAVKACVLEKPFVMKYKGSTLFHYVKDIAQIFIDCALALKDKPGSYHCNIGGNTVTVDKFLARVFEELPGREKLISISSDAIVLPFPDKMEHETLEKLLGRGQVPITPLREAIGETIAIFRQLRRENRLHSRDLASKL